MRPMNPHAPERHRFSQIITACVPIVLIGGWACSRPGTPAATNITTAPSPLTGTNAPANSPTAYEAREAARAGSGRRHVLTGTDALGDWTTDAPGVRRHITVESLPQPYATRSVQNDAHWIPRPANAWPQAPKGFQVDALATGFQNPRYVTDAPNGDIFVVESKPGRVKIIRAAEASNKEAPASVFTEGLTQPFGIAFYPPGPNPRYVYVANTNSVVRFPYQNGDTKARGSAETVVSDISGGGRLHGGGHWTRDIKFSLDGKKMYVSVGSLTNDLENPSATPIEARRARIFVFNPDGSDEQVYAYGIRNAVGLSVNPVTGQLWCSVNERDELGDHLPPDYITHVQPGGFYGWPWFYLGPNQDPRHPGAHPELRDKVTVPDVLVQSHSASLGMCFYTGTQFPKEYKLDGFAAEHGSWNRRRRTGYKVIRVPMQNGKATGEYEDFLTGFVTPEGEVWGRPVCVAVAKDGSLLVTDDGSNTLWRVRYVSGGRQSAHR